MLVSPLRPPLLSPLDPNLIVAASSITYSGRSFDGINQYFSIADNPDLSIGLDVPFTIAGWAMRVDLDDILGLFSKGDTGVSGGEYYAFSWNAHGGLYLDARKADDSAAVGANSGSGLDTANVWKWVEFVHDPLLDRLGSRAASVGQIGSVSLTNGTLVGGVYDGVNAFYLGRISSGYYYSGGMTAWGFWKRLLTDAERLWLNSAVRIYTDLGQEGNDGADLLTDIVSYWNLNEESGDAIDSHNGNTLTAQNSPGSLIITLD